ncbi:Ras GTPase activating protein ira2 [Balamuthia mandrillaris]
MANGYIYFNIRLIHTIFKFPNNGIRSFLENVFHSATILWGNGLRECELWLIAESAGGTTMSRRWAAGGVLVMYFFLFVAVKAEQRLYYTMDGDATGYSELCPVWESSEGDDWAGLDRWRLELGAGSWAASAAVGSHSLRPSTDHLSPTKTVGEWKTESTKLILSFWFRMDKGFLAEAISQTAYYVSMIGNMPSTWLFYLTRGTYPCHERWRLGFAVGVNGQLSPVASQSQGERCVEDSFWEQWNHVAFSFDYAGSSYAFYINGNAAGFGKGTSGSFEDEEGSYILFGGKLYGIMGGTLDDSVATQAHIDQVRIFTDEVIDGEFIHSLTKEAEPAIPPSINIALAGSPPKDEYEQEFVEKAVLLSNLEPSQGRSASDDGYRFSWLQVVGSCYGSSMDGTTSSNMTVTFLDRPSTFKFQLCVTDTKNRLSSRDVITLTSVANQPTILEQPEPEVDIADGYEIFIPVELGAAYPTPFYQWQRKTNDSDYYDDYLSDEGSDIARRVMVEYFIYDRQQDNGTSSNNSSQPTNALWTDVPKQNSNAFRLSNYSREEWDGAVIRLKVSNGVGEALFSNNITIHILNFVPDDVIDGDDGTEEDTKGEDEQTLAIALGVSLSVVACCVCLVVVSLVAIVKAKVMASPTVKKLKRPDFLPLVYGGELQPRFNISSSERQILERLERAMLEDDMVLVDAFFLTVRTTEADRLVKAILPLFHHQSKALPLILHCITHEVLQSNTETTLFRANSIASKLFTFYSRMIGLPYLWSTLAIAITEMNDVAKKDPLEQTGYELEEIRRQEDEERDAHMKEEDWNASGGSLLLASMEIDPSKAGVLDADAQEVNSLQLWLVAQKLLVTIKKSHHKLPQELRVILRHVQQEVSAKFDTNDGNEEGELGEVSYKALGGFLFLRFFCPALMAPQVYGLLDEAPHPTAQRQLILLAKIMQNLANGTLPSKKEAFMQRLDSFITTNKSSLSAFYATIIAHDAPSSSSSVSRTVPDEVRANGLVAVHVHALRFRKEVLAFLDTRAKEEEEGGSSSTAMAGSALEKKVELEEILMELDQPITSE